MVHSIEYSNGVCRSAMASSYLVHVPPHDHGSLPGWDERADEREDRVAAGVDVRQVAHDLEQSSVLFQSLDASWSVPND